MSYKYNKLEVSVGNRKIGNDTLILNLGSATECPSRKKGLCPIPDGKCYALKAERLYPECLPFRNRQATYWKTHSAPEIALDLICLLQKYPTMAKRIKYIRLNEAGDFYAQECIDKLNKIVNFLKVSIYNLIFYTYTARKDLDFSQAIFLVKGSSNSVGNNGRAVAFFKDSRPYKEALKKDYALCPGDCRECPLCKNYNKTNILFAIH